MPLDYKQTLINLIGANADASDEAIENSVRSFQTDMVAFKDETEESIRNLTSERDTYKNNAEVLMEANDELCNSNRTLTESLVEHDLAKYADVIVDRDSVREQLVSNRDETVKLLNSIRKGGDVPKAPLHNANGAGRPGDPTAGSTVVSSADAQKIMNRARDIQNTQRVPFSIAFDRARREFKS
jgi:hypothetical protein